MSFGNKTALFLFCSFLSLLCFTTQVVAQSDGLNVTITPEFPGPNQTITIEAEDYSRDLNRVEMIWTINGAVVQRGIGLKRYTAELGPLGTEMNLSITMGTRTYKQTIRPASVDLLWQADTRTAPFYKGKALHSNQDPLILVAEPFFINSQGTRMNPDSLVYRWKIDGTVDTEASGYGKKTNRHFSSILTKPITVIVEVFSADNTYKASSEIVIPETRPEVILYENHPLYGILFNNVLNNKNIALEDKEITVIGMPFFFSSEQIENGLSTFEWRLNNSLVNLNTDELVFRKPDTGTGRSSVSLAIKNVERFMQNANTSFNVLFDNTPETTGTIF